MKEKEEKVREVIKNLKPVKELKPGEVKITEK